jgi:hypothetical protein
MPSRPLPADVRERLNGRNASAPLADYFSSDRVVLTGECLQPKDPLRPPM